MEYEIEKPQELYDEIAKLITIHYKIAGHSNGLDPFARSYPNLYRLYLGLAAGGVKIAGPMGPRRRSKKP